MLTYSSRRKSLKFVIESNSQKNSLARCDYSLSRKKKSTSMKLRSQGKGAKQSISRFCPLKSLKKSHPVNKTRNLQVKNTSVCEIYSWCPVEDDNFPHGNERLAFLPKFRRKNSKILKDSPKRQEIFSKILKINEDLVHVLCKACALKT